MSTGYVGLERAGEGTALPLEDCRNVVRLAERYGWRDRTAARVMYFPGDGIDDDAAELSEDQAQTLAAALTSALPDIPDHDARRHKLRPCGWAGPKAAEQGWLEEDPNQSLSLLERFSGDEKELLKDLIVFLRAGAVRVVWQRW